MYGLYVQDNKDEHMMKKYDVEIEKGAKTKRNHSSQPASSGGHHHTKTLTDDLHQPGLLYFGLSKRVGDRHSCKNVQARPCYFSSWLF